MADPDITRHRKGNHGCLGFSAAGPGDWIGTYPVLGSPGTSLKKINLGQTPVSECIQCYW